VLVLLLLLIILLQYITTHKLKTVMESCVICGMKITKITKKRGWIPLQNKFQCEERGGTEGKEGEQKKEK
jgi:hypothetical protein